MSACHKRVNGHVMLFEPNRKELTIFIIDSRLIKLSCHKPRVGVAKRKTEYVKGLLHEHDLVILLRPAVGWTTFCWLYSCARKTGTCCLLSGCGGSDVHRLFVSLSSSSSTTWLPSPLLMTVIPRRTTAAVSTCDKCVCDMRQVDRSLLGLFDRCTHNLCYMCYVCVLYFS